MSDPATTPETAGTRLRAGDRLGSQSVRRFVVADAMGERYETVFGSTTHALDVCVPPAGASSPGAADYAAFVDRVSRVRHPCLVRYFAAGEGAPRPGAAPVPWLRCEHMEGAAASVLETALDPEAGLPSDEDGLRAPTFADLLAACGGRLAPADRDAILGDVLEGLAHLHSLGLACGHLEPEAVSLGHVRHRTSPRAQLRIYAWPPDEAPADPSADLVLAAPLFRAALDASAPLCKPREAEELAAFADRLGAGAFATAADAAADFAAFCARRGRPRASAAEEEADAAADDSAPSSAAGAAAGRDGADARRPARRHRKSGPGGTSEVTRRLMTFLGIVAVISFVIAVGVVVYFYLSATAEAERRRVAALSGETRPPILVIPTVRPSEDLLSELPASVFDYTAEQLAAAASAPDDPRAPAAKARLALEALDAAGPGVSAAVFADAASKMAEALPALRAAAASDPSAKLLLGRAMLLGLGTPVDPDGGYARVFDASLDGLREADLILGDVFASGLKLAELRKESTVGRDRRAVAAWRRAAGTDANPSPQLRRAADRIAPMLRAGRGIPPANNDYPQWLGRLAAAGHVPSLVALSTPGGFASGDPAEALKYLRILARAQGADPARRAWAQYRMARMFEHGDGTPEPDPKAALLWYRRAAEGGSAEAMNALHRLLHAGTPAERKEAAKWKAAVATASPAPGLPLVSSLVVPPGAASAAAPARPAAPAAAPKASSPGAANRAAAPLPVRRPARPEAAEPEDVPLVPLTEEEPAAKPAPPKAAPKKKRPRDPAKNAAPARKKDSSK